VVSFKQRIKLFDFIFASAYLEPIKCTLRGDIPQPKTVHIKGSYLSGGTLEHSHLKITDTAAQRLFFHASFFLEPFGSR